MTLVWDIEFPQLAPKMVALKLADCANDRGDNIYPSIDTIERTTGCVKSTACKWLFAMEHCGLLKVVRRSAGGAHKDTTVRAFDLDLLRRLGPTVDKAGNDVPSELQLVETRAKRLRQADKDAEPIVVDGDDPRPGSAVTVFQIIPRTPPVSGGVTRPLNGWDANPTRPSDGRVDDSTRPPDGHHPSVERTSPVRSTDPNRQEPSRTVPLPPTPRNKRGARERADLIAEVRSAKPHCARAVDKLLAPVLTAVWLDAPNPVFAAGTLAEFAENQTDAVLAEALQLLNEPGKHYRRSSAKPSDISDAIRTARTVVETRAAIHKRGPLLWRGTPEFEAAIAKVAETQPAWAESLRYNDYVKRTDLKAFGIEQVPA